MTPISYKSRLSKRFPCSKVVSHKGIDTISQTSLTSHVCAWYIPEAIKAAPALFQKRRLVRQALMVYETGRKPELSSHFMNK